MVFVCVLSVKKASSAGLEAARLELEDRERLRDELQGLKVWLEAADHLLSEAEPSGSPQELQVRNVHTNT